ncbi:MAG: carboxypeptidase-like regulatory domain-containing protein [Candidatus Acidoferrales bacterium]
MLPGKKIAWQAALFVLCFPLAVSGATLRGKVYDAQTGAPVAATVYVINPEGRGPMRLNETPPLPGTVGLDTVEGKTDPRTGEFEILELIPGTRIVHVSAPGYGFEFRHVTIEEPLTEIPPIRVYRAGSVAGVVVDPAGRPVPDAPVSVNYTHPLIIGFIYATHSSGADQFPGEITDPEGRFNFELDVRPNTPFRLAVNAPPYLPVYTEPMTIQPGESVAGVRLLLLAKGMNVVVRVVDANLQPLQGAWVFFRSLDPPDPALRPLPAYQQERVLVERTNQNGLLEFKGVSAGRRLLAVRLHGYKQHREVVDIDYTRELVEIEVRLWPQ